MRTWNCLLGLLLAALTGCEEPLTPHVGTSRVVVEGWISDQQGPFEVKLSRTRQFNGQADFPDITGATVNIFDDSGESFALTNEVASGLYRTPEMELKGVPGRYYLLQFTLPDGTVYRSRPEELGEVPPIDKLARFNLTGFIAFEVTLAITYSDPPSPGNFYRWNFYSDGMIENQRNLILGDDRLINGSENRFEVRLFNIPDNAIIRVDQLSLSESAHNYLQQIKSQTENLGTTFGVAPTLVQGNLFNPNRPEEVVLGYFGASAIATREIKL